jgi:hypothetical protein
MQRAKWCTCSALAICFSGSLKRRLSFDPHKTIQILVYFLSVVDAGLGDLDRTCVAFADQFSNFANTKHGNLQLCHEIIPVVMFVVLGIITLGYYNRQLESER